MFCCTLLYVHSSIAIILMGKRELIALLNLSSWCLVMVERLFLAVPRGCLQFVIVVFPDHTNLLFLISAHFKHGFHCLINETDSPFDLTLLIICQSNANFKTEWVIQNELLTLKLGKSSIRMGLTWQGSDHIKEI